MEVQASYKTEFNRIIIPQKKNYAMNGQNTLNIVPNTQQITGNSQIIYINKNPSVSSNMSNLTNKNYSSNSQNYY